MRADSTVFGSLSGIITTAALLVVSVGISGVTPDTKAFWLLSRTSGLVAYLLLWLSVMAGLLISSRATSIVPPKRALGIHQMTSGTALAFAVFHGLVLAGDGYFNLSLLELIVPLTSAFKPVWMAAGQISLILLAAVLASSSMRRSLGNRAWRALHYSAFFAYWLALGHALVLGSDTGRPLIACLYAFTGVAVLWLTTIRIFVRERPNVR
jgi:methionine sulfoxide reductase heme-binding subunit